MRICQTSYLVLISLVTCVAGLMIGCENTMEPFDKERGLYSINGYLDLDEEENYIRVKDLNKPLMPDSTRSIDAMVTMENLNEGITEILQDKVVQFDDVYTHNFRTTLEMVPQTTYKITAERSDGKSMAATATTPRIAETSVGPTNQGCKTPIEMTFDPVQEVGHLDVSVGVVYGDHTWWATPVVQDGEGEAVHLRFTPLEVLDSIFYPPACREDGTDHLPCERIGCYELASEIFQVEYTHYGPDFFEDTATDSFDVVGGVGDFGALYRDSFSFPIDTTRVCKKC